MHVDCDVVTQKRAICVNATIICSEVAVRISELVIHKHTWFTLNIYAYITPPKQTMHLKEHVWITSTFSNASKSLLKFHNKSYIMQQEHALVDSILNYKQENLEKPIQAALLDITVSWNKDLKGFHSPNVTSIIQFPISNLCYNTLRSQKICGMPNNFKAGVN